MARRLLVVDDEGNLVFALKLFLEAEGYEVIPAYDGRPLTSLRTRPCDPT